MNAIALMGTLQSEPELRYTQDGLARLSVMLSFTADRPDEPDYQIRVVVFGNLAEESSKSLHHGNAVVVEGRLQAETRTRPDGSKEKVTEVIARRIHALAEGGARTIRAVAPEAAAPAFQSTAPRRPAPAAARPAAAPPSPPDDLDDIPF
jgi:single-strand DNA-binding protein